MSKKFSKKLSMASLAAIATVLGAVSFGSALNAQEKTVTTLSPSGTWTAREMAKGTPNAYCALSHQYSDGMVLTLGQNIAEEYSLAIDFQNQSLNIDKPYKISLQPSPGQIRAYEMMPASQQAMVIRLGFDDSFMKGLDSSGMLKANIDGKNYHFKIANFDKAKTSLANCMQSLETSSSVKTASSEFTAEKVENATPIKSEPSKATQIVKAESKPTAVETKLTEAKAPKPIEKANVPEPPPIRAEEKKIPAAINETKPIEAEKQLTVEKTNAEEEAEKVRLLAEKKKQEQDAAARIAVEKAAKEKAEAEKQMALKKVEEQKAAAQKAIKQQQEALKLAEMAKKKEAEAMALAQKRAEESKKREAEAQALAEKKAEEARQKEAAELALAKQEVEEAKKREAEALAEAKRLTEEKQKIEAEKLAAEEAKVEAQRLAAQKAMELQKQAGEKAAEEAEEKKQSAIREAQEAEELNKKAVAEKIKQEQEAEELKKKQAAAEESEKTKKETEDKKVALLEQQKQIVEEAEKELAKQKAFEEAQKQAQLETEARIEAEEEKRRAEEKAIDEAAQKAEEEKAKRFSEMAKAVDNEVTKEPLEARPLTVADIEAEHAKLVEEGKASKDLIRAGRPEVVDGPLTNMPRVDMSNASKEELQEMRRKMDELEAENRRLYLEALEARGDINSAVVDTSNLALQKIRDYEKKLVASQADNMKLSEQIEELKRIQEVDPAEAASGDWNLEQSTERYNEAEREIKRLGMLLEQQRIAHRKEKEELESMLFDPAVTDQEQRRRLAEMEAKLVAAERQLNMSGQTLQAINIAPPTPPQNIYGGSEQIPLTPVPENIGMPPSFPVPDAPQDEARFMEEQEIAAMNNQIRSENLDRVAPIGAKPIGRIEDRPVSITSSVGGVDGRELENILSRAGVGLNSPVSSQGAGQFNWQANGMSGYAQVHPLQEVGGLQGFVQNYISQARQSCAGDFASLPATNVTSGQGFEIACVGPSQNTSSSVLFTQRGNSVMAISHQTSAENMDMVIDMRDRIAGSL